MKIGIITLTGYYNYGNRLQNYASQEVLKSLGAEVETIEIYESLPHPNKIKKIILNLIANMIRLKLIPNINNEKIQKVLLANLNKDIEKIRTNRIYNWSIKNIYNSKYKIKNKKIPQELSQYFDYFITGSDQVWNPYFTRYPEIYFLSFAKPEQRISFSASFGLGSIPDEYCEKYKELINGMSHVSVRERAGKGIVEKLTSKKASILIDPTMMLDKNDWLKVTEKPKGFPTKKYILTYVLGERIEKLDKLIKVLQEERDLEIIDILNPDNKDIYCSNPGEFIYLINNADIMVTDSFHGAVFSIIMKTPFVIFERQDPNFSMNSRIDTLVTTFKMQSRLSSNIKTIEDIYNIDFTHVDEILTVEREKAIRYLKNAFSME